MYKRRKWVILQIWEKWIKSPAGGVQQGHGFGGLSQMVSNFLPVFHFFENVTFLTLGHYVLVAFTPFGGLYFGLNRAL